MSRFIFLVALSLVCTACSGGADTRCVGIVDAAIDVYQELVSTVDELDLTEVSEGAAEFAIPRIAEIEQQADDLQIEADAAGCDDAELRELLTERIGRLEARTVFGQAVIEGIRREGLFEE